MPDGLYSKSQACQAYIVWLGLKEKPGTGIQASWSNKPTHPVSLVITSPPDRLALLSLPIQNTLFRPGLLAHTFNPSTWEAEAGGFPSSKPAWSTEWVPGQPGLHRETLSRKKKSCPKPHPMPSSGLWKNLVQRPVHSHQNRCSNCVIVLLNHFHVL